MGGMSLLSGWILISVKPHGMARNDEIIHKQRCTDDKQKDLGKYLFQNLNLVHTGVCLSQSV